MINIIIQILIVVSSCGAIWLLSQKGKWNRWGYIVGIVGQPLWFYDTLKNEQWGILAVTVWFTFSYAQGIRNFWINK